jgi:hypothetical protein
MSEEITYKKRIVFGCSYIEHTCPVINDFNDQGSHQYRFILTDSEDGGWFIKEKIFSSHSSMSINYCPFCGHNLDAEYKKILEATCQK